MFRFQPRGRASALMLGAALSTINCWAKAQTTLPSVTVEAPQTAARTKPVAQKPRVRAASVRR
ncbi:hypothetical protein, partial [Bradyrhizobium sp. NAS96.2]